MIYLADPDVTLHQGDVLDCLAELPDGSVDCVVTSPPYWGLRDYGTGTWEGGDEGCDHTPALRDGATSGLGATADKKRAIREGYSGATCGKCGALRIDNQIGLEDIPDAYLARMVDVFREVRRVLAPHGTCWVNMGDSYNSRLDGSHGGWNGSAPGPQRTKNDGAAVSISAPGMKPKDLIGMPWRLALALQADGWWLRADIIWAKPNPMPESVTDRPTKSHEYVFLLTKQARYFYDADAVREPNLPASVSHHARYGARPSVGAKGNPHRADNGGADTQAGVGINPAGRNLRTVWNIPTQPYPEAHFATFPTRLPELCILAGCPERVCVTCGKPSERVVESEIVGVARNEQGAYAKADGKDGTNHYLSKTAVHGSKVTTTVGFTDCGHNAWRPGRVLDPFAGSGTTLHVARKHGRHSIGIELNPDYCELAARRLAQLSLLSEQDAAGEVGRAPSLEEPPGVVQVDIPEIG